jgi:hypothetical protein
VKEHLKTFGLVVFRLAVFVALTVVTQVGGVIFLLHLLLMRLAGWKKRLVRWPAFLALYLLFTFFAIPPIARMNNRVPLPFFDASAGNVRPHSPFFSLANRHYVRPELRDMILEVAAGLEEAFPGLEIEYLDANFPLLKEFRMYPHIRHDDGRKLDITYVRKKPSGEYAYRYFSLFGYGYSVKPLHGEIDKPRECGDKGFWQYNIIEKFVPDQLSKGHTFPVEENRMLLERMAGHPAVRYVITEPHLKQRVGLDTIENIGSLGCWAIRHDDHIHVVAPRERAGEDSN